MFYFDTFFLILTKGFFTWIKGTYNVAPKWLPLYQKFIFLFKFFYVKTFVLPGEVILLQLIQEKVYEKLSILDIVLMFSTCIGHSVFRWSKMESNQLFICSHEILNICSISKDFLGSGTFLFTFAKISFIKAFTNFFFFSTSSGIVFPKQRLGAGHFFAYLKNFLASCF